MENEKPKMERYQVVLLALGWVFLVVSVVLLVFQIMEIMDMLPPGYYVISLGLSSIFKDCAQWKQRPISSTVFIGLWCLLIGFSAGLMMFR